MKRFFILLFSISVLLNACGNYEEIKISSVKNAEMKKINKDGIDVDLLVQFSNPNTLGFNIYKSKCEVYISGKMVGKSKLINKVKIPGNTSESQLLPLHISFENPAAMIGMGNNIELKGWVTVGKFIFRKKIRVDIKDKIPFKSGSLIPPF